MHLPIDFAFSAVPYRYRGRTVSTALFLIVLLASLVVVSGCSDVKGAASGTAGQLNEREKRDKEATAILDSGTRKQWPNN